MGRKPKWPAEIKVCICEQYLRGNKSLKQLVHECKLGKTTLHSWIKLYASKGASAFNTKLHNAAYTKEFKQQVVEAYLNEDASLEDLTIRYDISSHETLRRWIMRYDNLAELKDYAPKPKVYTKDRSRKTTLEERIKIVNSCLEHENSYKQAAELFDVSYTQLDQWVRNYQSSGEEGLVDRRGQNKCEEELSDIETLERKVKILERQLREKEMEKDLLKKCRKSKGGDLLQDEKRNKLFSDQGTSRGKKLQYSMDVQVFEYPVFRVV